MSTLLTIALVLLASCDRSRSVSIAATCDDVAVTAHTNASRFTGGADGDVEVTIARTKREIVPVIIPMPVPYVAKSALAERP